MIEEERFARYGRLVARAAREGGPAWADVCDLLLELLEAQDAKIDELSRRVEQLERGDRHAPQPERAGVLFV